MMIRIRIGAEVRPVISIASTSPLRRTPLSNASTKASKVPMPAASVGGEGAEPDSAQDRDDHDREPDDADPHLARARLRTVGLRRQRSGWRGGGGTGRRGRPHAFPNQLGPPDRGAQ